MSRRIEGGELQDLQFAINEAREVAQTSICQRDHRGSVVFKNGEVLGAASNGPIPPYECDTEKCGGVCGIFAMHAERLSIIKALEDQQDLTDASVLHVRINDNGEVQVSGDLRCEDCTGYMARIGRNKKGMHLKEFILLQEDGWRAYSIEEADEVTRKNLGVT